MTRHRRIYIVQRFLLFLVTGALLITSFSCGYQEKQKAQEAQVQAQQAELERQRREIQQLKQQQQQQY